MYNIFKYKKREKIKTDTGYIDKAVLRKPDKDGYSYITEYNKDDLLVSQTSYLDENYTDLGGTIKFKYHKDKSFIRYDIYEQDREGWTSSISDYDNKKRLTYCKWYKDKDFKDLIIEEIFEYNNDSSYKVVHKDYLSEEYFIYFYNKKGIKTKTISYKDNDFKEIEYSANIKQLKNGNIIYYYLEDNIETLYNNNTDWTVLSEKYYKTKDFKNLDYTYFYKYFKDGSYERKTVFENNTEYESQCVIEKFDKNDELTERRDYKDKNARKIYYIETFEYPDKNIIKKIYNDISENRICYHTEEILENGHKICSETFDLPKTHKEYEYLSIKYETDKDGNHLWEKEYSDNNFKELSLSRYYEYLENGNIIQKDIYEKSINNCYAYKSEKDKDGHFLNNTWFEDKEMKNPYNYDIYEYLPDGNIIRKGYRTTLKDDEEYMSIIEIKDKDQKTLNVKYFKDKNFEDLFGTIGYTYKTKDEYTEKAIFTEPHDGYMSSISTHNKDKIKALSYYDNNFKNLYRKSFWKKNKKGEKIALRIYEKMQNNEYISTVEKYTPDKELIYSKKYKTKWIIPRLIYFFTN